MPTTTPDRKSGPNDTPDAASASSSPRPISLALQGGGAHGAFTWGVLDRLLQDERVTIEAISGTSAGAMNAAVLASGMAGGGREGARRALDRFWAGVSEYGALSPVQRTPVDRLMGRWDLDNSPAYHWFGFLNQLFSPYQTNPLNYQPLRDILAGLIDVDALHACESIKVFVAATNVRTGRARIFQRNEVSLDALLASACLPHLFQAVEIEGDAYWDGGYMGNPVIWPLIYHAANADVVLVQINPLERGGVPRTPQEINDRIDEIAFNSSLIHEMRAISFVQRLLEHDALKEPFASRYRNMRIHMIANERAMEALGVSSKSNAERDFLEHLKAVGRASAERWLARTLPDLGVRSSVDVRATFL